MIVIAPCFGYTIAQVINGRCTYLTTLGTWLSQKTASEEEKSQVLRFSTREEAENHYETWEKTKND